MQGAITKRAIDALPIPASGEAVLWDREVRGFGVRVRPGGAKTFIVQYRAGNGRGAPVRKLVIGKYGSPWTPASARAEAKHVLGLVAAGQDPAGAKADRRAAPTMADLATRFLSDHVAPKRKNRTGAEYCRLLDRIIIPAIGAKKVVDVTRADVSRLHHAQRKSPYQANRVIAVLGKMFSMAEGWGMRPDGSNPCKHVERFPERGRERMLSAAELARLGDALNGSTASPYIVAAVKLLLFTGARLSEILTLKWEQVDFERGEARLADSKTGVKTVQLPPPALAVLATLPRIDGNAFVIVGQREGACLVNLEKPWRAIRAAAGLNDLRLHDLRHAFASVGAAGGDSLLVIGRLLGHSQAATTQRYAHLAPDPIKAAGAKIAGTLAAALNGRDDDEKVVAIRG